MDGWISRCACFAFFPSNPLLLGGPNPFGGGGTRPGAGIIYIAIYAAGMSEDNYNEQIDMWSVGCIYAELLQMLEGTHHEACESCLARVSWCFPLIFHGFHLFFFDGFRCFF